MKEDEKKKPVTKAVEKLKQRPHEAAHILDKNSRTMVKIMQLLEACEKPEARELDKDKLVMSYVEKLKSRMSRRLNKLAKWSDLPAEERNPRSRRDPSLPPRALPYCAAVVYPPMVAAPAVAPQPPQPQAQQPAQRPPQPPQQSPQKPPQQQPPQQQPPQQQPPQQQPPQQQPPQQQPPQQPTQQSSPEKHAPPPEKVLAGEVTGAGPTEGDAPPPLVELQK